VTAFGTAPANVSVYAIRKTHSLSRRLLEGL
jgi:hypothetical protein